MRTIKEQDSVLRYSTFYYMFACFCRGTLELEQRKRHKILITSFILCRYEVKINILQEGH